jgi:hypothetical protein
MSRQVIAFEKFSDFVDKSVRKQSLASLFVSLENVLKIYAEGEADMKKIFINESIYLDQANKPDHQKRVNELAKIRNSRKQKLLAAYKLVRDARNKNFSEEEWLPEFTHPLDLFNNISDTIPGSDLKDTETLGSNIEDLNRQVNHYRAEYDTKVEQLDAVNNDLARYKRLLDEANEKLRSAVPSGSLDRTTVRASYTTSPSLPEYKGNFKLYAKTPVTVRILIKSITHQISKKCRFRQFSSNKFVYFQYFKLNIIFNINRICMLVYEYFVELIIHTLFHKNIYITK